MASSFSSNVDDLFNLHEQTLKWDANSIMITIASSLDNDAPIEVNLSDTIGKVVHVSKNLSHDEVYWLPRRFSINTPEFCKSDLSPFFMLACKKAGFSVKLKGWENKYGYVPVVCQRERFHLDYTSTPSDEGVDVMTSTTEVSGSATQDAGATSTSDDDSDSDTEDENRRR